MKSQFYPSLRSEELPPCLKEIADSPQRLFYRGHQEVLLHEPKVAVIGTRQPTSYGQKLAEQVGRALAEAGVRVVSGLARGIDGLVQRAVVAAGGETIAVLGSAIDNIRPISNRSLAEDIVRRGIIVSEYEPGLEFRHWHYPARNRIISGLSRAVVIIEAGEGSGTLITARYALDQGREVLAFPGPVDSALSAGTHALIREGARLVRNSRDILEDLGLGGALELPFEKSPVSPYNDEEINDPVLGCLSGTPLSLETLVEKSGLELAELSRLLLQEEIAGRIRQLPGPCYVRCG